MNKGIETRAGGRASADYNADIAQGTKGNFLAKLRNSPISIVSADPEHDLCHAMVKSGLPDGTIQFWRGNTPSLFYPSVSRAAKVRISQGRSFPYDLVKRRDGAPEIFKNRDSIKTYSQIGDPVGTRVASTAERGCGEDPGTSCEGVAK